MNRKFVILCLILSTFFLTNNSRSQLDAVLAGGFFGTKLVGDVLDGINRTVQQLTENAINGGNALVSKNANELSVAAQNASILLDGQMQKHVSDLSIENQRLISRLQEMNDTLKAVSDKPYALLETASLSMRDLIGELPLSRKTSFYIGNIAGLTQLPQDTSYQLTFKGIGFGPDSDNRRNSITKISINEAKVNGFYEQRVEDYETVVNLPSASLKPLFREKEITFAKIEVEASVQTKNIFGVWKTRVYPFRFSIALTPMYAGTIHITYTEPIMDWVTVNPKKEFSFESPDHDQPHGKIKNYSYLWSSVVNDNQRFAAPVGFRLGDENNFWLWSNLNPAFHEGKVEILEDAHRLQLAYTVWGKSFYVYPYAAIQEWKIASTKKSVVDRNLYFGQMVTVEVPASVTGWLVEGKTVTNAIISTVNTRDSDILDWQDIIPSQTTKVLVWKVAFPNGFDPSHGLSQLH
ncbi:MAG TPA: hypothetical protein VGC39_09035 [Candidatus Methylacidiphilales bacterium]